MKYKSGFKYQLEETERFQTALRPSRRLETPFIILYCSGEMTVFRGYAWDGASGPTIDTKNSMRGTLFHDAAYQLMRLGLLSPEWRETVDDEFGRFLKEDGMWWLRRKLWVREVKKFGGSAADPRNKKPVLEAP